MNQRLTDIRRMSRESVADCIKYPQHSVGIFSKSDSDMRFICDEIIKRIPPGKIERNCQSVKNQIGIRLTNGSTIDIFSNSMIGCMRRYTSVAYDEALNRQYIDAVARCLPRTGGKMWKLASDIK